ncbi:MAG: hypothetical protein OXF89_01110 [Rhodospirillaceae bacterium]|nr:hypothetical protein [Rhodospirillaceae bacterium]
MAYADPEVGRAADRERFRKRTAARVAQGMCPRCGERPPVPERSLCGPCNEKRNAASRARDARLRAEGKPRRNPGTARQYERERSRREAAERKAAGLCTRCGTEPAAPGRSSCEPCLEKRRAADRARYAAGKAAGLPYGGANADAKRRAGRAKSKRRQKARLEAGLCIRCGQHPPVEDGTTCAPCREKRQAAEKRQYAERRAAGLCTRCGAPVHDGLSRCAPCAVIDEAGRNPERKNARSRKLYAERRAAGLCTACGAPSQGASRCAPCAEKSYHGSAHFRGIPIWDPRWTVVELDTGREHGPFDSEADVALCLAFEKLDRNRVEVVSDASPMASLTSWG